MIQRMNNVLIKHSKVLFGVITIVIIISFVWFFTPGADGSLLFGQSSNVIAKIGETEVTMGDAERAQKSATLSQASALYAAYGEKAAEFFSRMGRMGDEQIRILTTTIKLAELQGFAVADSEVQEVLKNDPAFQENGKFSSKKYEAFLAVLDEAGYSTEDYENATRDALLLQKFRMNAFAGVTEPTASEIETDIAPLLFKYSTIEVSCNTNELGKTLAAPTEEELKEEYNSDLATYKTHPTSEATIFFINNKDVKEGDAKTLLGEIVKEAGITPAAESLKAIADKKGIKLQTAVISDVTTKTLPSPLADEGMIKAICNIPEANKFSPIISNKDTAAVALLTKREDAKQLDFEAAKAKVAERLKTKKANQKAEEILNAFKADIVSGKVALDKIAEEGKKRGLIVGTEQIGVASNAEIFHMLHMRIFTLEMQLQHLISTAQSGDQQMIEAVDRLKKIIMEGQTELDELYLQKVGYARIKNNTLQIITKAEPATAEKELLESHTAYLSSQKRYAASMSWEAWYEKEITAAISPYIQKSEQPAPAAE